MAKSGLKPPKTHKTNPFEVGFCGYSEVNVTLRGTRGNAPKYFIGNHLQTNLGCCVSETVSGDMLPETGSGTTKQVVCSG